MAKNVLVVTTVAAREDELRRQLQTLLGGGETNVRIVAPAAKLSWLDWLTNDEDRARADARAAAERTAVAIGDSAEARIDRTSQNSDAAQAVADALRNFDAEEIVVLTRPGDDAAWLEDETARAAFDSFGVPVRHLQLADEP